MLDDDRRTEAYLAALTKAVRPEDVVLDIGTGTGVLAVAAARAGARHVYAVEATDIADVAERVFTANGVGDRVTLIRGGRPRSSCRSAPISSSRRSSAVSRSRRRSSNPRWMPAAGC